MATSVTPPPLQGPSSKEKRYDRQLRLWAASGQQALEDAHVLLVNSGPGVVGVEALKNLVLPGAGNFTIVDDATVTEADLGVHFFLEDGSLGHPRAEGCCKLLMELNPDVTGNQISKASFYIWRPEGGLLIIVQSIQSLLEQSDFLKSYSLVLITAPIQIKVLSTICQYAWKHSIPLFYIHSIGFYSQFSIQLPPQYPIVDTHPDPTSTQDLRLLNPWPELSQYVADKCDNLDALSDHDHGHVPYLLLLLHYLEIWKASHDGKYPENYKEKTVFREMVRGGARVHNAEGGEENYDEAVGAVLKSLNPPSLSSGVQEVLSVEDCKTPSSQSANFWIVAHAIRLFHETHGVLPLPGSLPDMKAQSSDYIKLQNIYKAKARQDFAEVLQTVRSVEKRLARKNAIEEKEVEAFCKGAAFVRLIHGRRLQIAEDKLNWDGRAKNIQAGLQDPESLLPIHIAFLAYDQFLNAHSRAPGEDSSKYDQDLRTMTEYTQTILAALSKEASSTETYTETAQEAIDKVVSEIVRAGGGELHNISALTGGMVAQEVIKVITKQYIPVDNTCMFDGIGSRSAVFRL
ncbi:MAG: hypothetical protein M1830_001127 [Pleopsidium flavum]|nr:MAG: hypothetical protein M1830_001127 [Pleopsidium flavum]